jgi:hypothetical protein
LHAQQARNLLIGIATGLADVDSHIGAGIQGQQALPLGKSQLARIVELDDDILQPARRSIQLALPPLGIGRGIVQIERRVQISLR